MTGSNRNCGKWYTVFSSIRLSGKCDLYLYELQVQEGDTCSLVSVYNFIALSDFYFLNPEINSNCTNLDLGEAYCVQAVGSISTYSGYSVKGPTITLSTPLSTSSPTSTSSQPFTGTVATRSALPTASGTITNCCSYRNYTSDGGTTTNTFNIIEWLCIHCVFLKCGNQRSGSLESKSFKFQLLTAARL